MNQTPPGWYQDPQGAGQRYWDGNAWTEQVAPAAAQASPAQAPAPYAAAPGAGPQGPYPGSPGATGGGGGRNTGKIVGIIAGVIGAIVVVLIIIGAAAGTTIDAGKAEDLVRSHINGAQSVHCPSDVEAKSGKTFDCTVSLSDGSSETVTLHITDDKGHAQFGASDVHRP